MTKLSQYGIKLALHIISTDFGNLVAKVCECLLRKGTLPMLQISKLTDLPLDKVKQCLLVLIQHNCVQAFCLELEGGPKNRTSVVTHYMVVFNNIIHRSRLSKFMIIVSKETDNQGSQLFEGLVHHGRLTLTQSLDRAVECSSEGNTANRIVYQESFQKLVDRRFIERCPAAEPLISTEDDPPAKRGGGRSKIFRKEVTLEERVFLAATPMDAERFSIVSDPGVDSDGDKSRKDGPSVKVGEKRKQDSLKSASELDKNGGVKEPLWRVNYEEFINHLRIQACVEYARAEYDNATAMILNCMLAGTKCTEDTVSLSLESIFEEVIKTEEGCSMNLERIRHSLEQLCFCSEAEDLYTIRLSDIIKQAQLEEVEAVVSKRYGKDAFKIFRCLSNGRPLDTDKISDKTFVDKKLSPPILCTLWKDNFLHMEKISTGGPRQTDFFLWSLKKDALWNQVLDELFHAKLNMLLRLAFEMEQDREVLNVKRQGRQNEEIDKRRNRLRKIRDLLLSSMLKLDDAIMLFNDFLS